MSFASDFKEFALKGNVMDLAVGVIIGAAFGKIVDSLVGDVIMPVVSKLFGGLDFSNYFVPLAGQTATTLAEAKKAGAVLAYGNFVTIALNFVILAFIVFLMVKQINKLKKTTPPAPPATPEDVVLLREIRDALNRRYSLAFGRGLPLEWGGHELIASRRSLRSGLPWSSANGRSPAPRPIGEACLRFHSLEWHQPIPTASTAACSHPPA
jgi:large conductance mechanosensitive channel